MSYCRILTFIDHRLSVIKQAHNQFMSGLVDVIMTNVLLPRFFSSRFMNFYIKN
jgi:hypothetical protein